MDPQSSSGFLMSVFAEIPRQLPLRICVSGQVRADLVGRVYHLTFPARPAATACVRMVAGSRWDAQRQVWLMPAGDAERVRATLERIGQLLAFGARQAKSREVPDEEGEPRVLVRDGVVSVGQQVSTPEGWAVIDALGPAFRGGERLPRDGRADLIGVALRWAYYRPVDRKVA